MPEINTDAIRILLASPSISRQLFDELMRRLQEIESVNK